MKQQEKTAQIFQEEGDDFYGALLMVRKCVMKNGLRDRRTV
jgi:hypothetical protein